jgi:nitroimidazol reductase NimA-like FMN-containing flavoprotein (pyridoxamine 5'-phosphate oxidase superfamily)
MSVVYYVMDGDDILISTMKARGKAKSLERNSDVSLCVLDEQWPLKYLVVYGRGQVIDDEGEALALMKRITELMSGVPPTEEDGAKIAQMCLDEHRVVARITPVSTFETPPRHIHSDTDISTLTHGLGNTIAWGA